MYRLSISALVVLTVLFTGGQLSAAPIVHFSDGFESSDGHVAPGSSQSIVPNNGWANNGGQEPVVTAGSGSLFGDNFACVEGYCITGGSGAANVLNDAGISGGMDPTRPYTLTWDWEVALGNQHSGDFGGVAFQGMRSSIVYQPGHGRFNISDPGDSDEGVYIPATQKIYQMKIVHSPTEGSDYYIDGVHEFGGPAAFTGVGIRMQGNGGGHMDNFLLTSVPEPTSLVLLAMGSLGLVVRRRR